MDHIKRFNQFESKLDFVKTIAFPGMTNDDFKIIVVDENDKFRDSVLNEIKDILFELYDNDFNINIHYGVSMMGYRNDVLSISLHPDKFFKEIEIETVIVLDKTIKENGFISSGNWNLGSQHPAASKPKVLDGGFLFRYVDRKGRPNILVKDILEIQSMMRSGSRIDWITMEYTIPSL